MDIRASDPRGAVAEEDLRAGAVVVAIVAVGGARSERKS